jgi:UDP-N-acetylmuramyl pentapeptide phosphotransferase/UDP-N-acetylglucosamine-1-phosphate transferase
VTLFYSDWMDFAICTPDPAWTSDTPPDAVTLSRLGAICAVCPVSAACASYALDNRCQTGMYAGVWLPTAGTGNAGWLDARRSLARKAKQLVARVSAD